MSRVHRAYRTSGSGGAAPLPGLGVTMPGASFLIDDRSARDGNAAGTLAGQFFAIPGSGATPNRVFHFTQADAGGTQRGVFPGLAYPALAAYVRVPIPLPNGILTPAQVATQAAAVLAAYYPTVSITGGRRVDIRGSIVPGSASTGTDWASRGAAGAWGMQRVDGGNFSFEQVDTTVTYGVGPVLGSTGYLRGLEVFLGASVSTLLRLAVYNGGGFRAPAGAPLLHDFGQIPATAGPDGWARVYATSDVVLPSAANLQVTCKGAPGSGTFVGYGQGGALGDYTGGLFDASAVLGTDPAVAFPATFPAGGVNGANNFAAGVRLLYETTPIAANGGWLRRYGVHQPASAMVTETQFDANVLSGGGLPPQVEDMRVSAVEILAVGDASFRLGVLQGGVIEDPGGGVLLWDAGRGPAGPGLPIGRYRIDAPAGVMVDRTQTLWWWSRADGTQGPIRFALSGSGAQANPLENPMDWPQNTGPGDLYEYETFPANTAHSTDPDVGFESPFVTDPSDTTPGNYPGASLELAVDGLTFTTL